MNPGEKGEGERRRRSAAKRSFSSYVGRILSRSARAVRRFRFHTILFGSVNALLLVINLVTGIAFPWFVFPLGGWAILVADHYALLLQRRRQEREVRLIDDLSIDRTRLLRRFHRHRSAFTLVWTSSVSTALFLGMTNLIVSPTFPWALITAASLALVTLLHYLGYSGRRRGLLDQLAAEPGTEAFLREAARGMSRRLGPPPSGELAEAERIYARILGDLKLLGPEFGHQVEELSPMLDRYLERVRSLEASRAEIAGRLDDLGTTELTTERAEIAAKLSSAQSESLREEYRRALTQLDARRASLEKLAEQRELAALRIASALGLLRQLEIDVVRLKGLAHPDEAPLSRLVEERSEELARFLDDLAEGQREVDGI